MLKRFPPTVDLERRQKIMALLFDLIPVDHSGISNKMSKRFPTPPYVVDKEDQLGQPIDVKEKKEPKDLLNEEWQTILGVEAKTNREVREKEEKEKRKERSGERY